MVSEDNKLNLLQFIPFPLSQSLGANTTITPKVDQHLDRKERLEYLQLKKNMLEYEMDQRNHPNIIRVGDRVPQHVSMADYTVETPTLPVAPSVYPNINKKPTQY